MGTPHTPITSSPFFSATMNFSCSAKKFPLKRSKSVQFQWRLGKLRENWRFFPLKQPHDVLKYAATSRQSEGRETTRAPRARESAILTGFPSRHTVDRLTYSHPLRQTLHRCSFWGLRVFYDRADRPKPTRHLVFGTSVFPPSSSHEGAALRIRGNRVRDKSTGDEEKENKGRKEDGGVETTARRGRARVRIRSS
jgi:hypothetical protein